MEHKVVNEKIKILSAKDASDRKLAEAIHDLGELGDPMLHDHVAPFLTHPTPRLRYRALSTLGIHWGLGQYRRQFEEMLRTDPDEYVRSMAASCLSIVLKGTRDKPAAQLLIAKLRDENEHPMVRESAYDALLDIWAPDSEAHKSRAQQLRDQAAAVEDLEEKIRRARERGEDTSPLFEKWDRLWMQWVDWQLVDRIDKESQLDKL